tara:strand:- start:41 stop:319 length:279 start_codon:yes stop_codon:yes gene_type:complete
MNKKQTKDKTMKIKAGDIVECIKHPKYSKEFEGQAQVTKVLEVPNGYLWVDWHYGFGMILANKVKLAADQSKCIVATPKYMKKQKQQTKGKQ